MILAPITSAPLIEYNWHLDDDRSSGRLLFRSYRLRSAFGRANNNRRLSTENVKPNWTGGDLLLTLCGEIQCVPAFFQARLRFESYKHGRL
jgi:hypothetical protein